MDGYDGDEMWRWIEEITSHGPRRPGSPGDAAVEDWLEGKLRGFGFEDVRREPIAIRAWKDDEARLEVRGADGGVVLRPEVQCIPYVRFGPEGGDERPLRFFGSAGGADADWRGAIVVAEVAFPRIRTASLRRIAIGEHDPDGTLGEVDHPATWVRLNWHLYREAVKRRAAGFVGILKDQPGGTCRMFAPYGFREGDIMAKPVPGVWVGRDQGEALKRLALAGKATARLVVRGTDAPGTTHNIVAELPGRGADDEAIVLSCHHDSPYASPVEDASGCSVVLALARRLAETRPLRRRLIVLFSAGHFYGSIGTRTFIESHPEVVRRTVLEVSIEHVALEAREGPDGRLEPTGRPEATAMFVSFSPAIAEAVLEGSASHGLDRVILLPAEGPLGNYPPSDGGDWYQAGVPVINCISNPVYLLTDEDGPEWVDRPRLAKVAAAFDQILRRLDAEPRASLASVKSRGYKLRMKALTVLTRAWATRLGFREFY